MCYLFFVDCEIPKNNLFGGVGYGCDIAVKTVDAERIGNAGQAHGIAQTSLELAATLPTDLVSVCRF